MIRVPLLSDGWNYQKKRKGKRKDKGTRLTVELQRCVLLKPAIVLGGS